MPVLVDAAVELKMDEQQAAEARSLGLGSPV